MDKFKTYLEYSEHPVSEKITIAHVNCKQRAYGFTQVDSSDIYFTIAQLFVVACQSGVTSLESVSSTGAITSSGKYYYDSDSSKLYVHSAAGFTNEDTDPEIIPTYRMFFSSVPINLSWDLQDHSHDVYYEPRIQSSPGFSSQLGADQMGISIVGSGTLKLNNGDLFFKDYYDLYIFDNQEVSIYSYNRSLDPSAAKILYTGKITDMSYDQSSVSIKVKDVINALNEEINLGKFSEITDTINISSEVGKYVKRRIYGLVDSLRCQSVDMLWDNDLEEEAFTLTGTVSGEFEKNILTGTNFLTEVSPGDKIIFSEDEEHTVDKVQNDTKLLLSDDLSKTYLGVSVKVLPERPFYNRNRKFLICGHGLVDVTTTITFVHERNRVDVVSTLDFRAGDFVSVGSQHVAIKRISGNTIVFRQNLAVKPLIGATILKEKIQNVQIRYPDQGYRNINLIRGDYSVTETSEGSYLNIIEDCEKNATLPRTLGGNFYTINGIDTIWLGIPTLFNIECVANTSNSLVGKYFTLYSDENDIVVWFSEKVDLDEDATDPPEFTFDVSYTEVSVANDTFYEPNHGLNNGQQISLSSTDTLPGGISQGYEYYVRESSTNYFKVSTTADGAIKDITSQGAGNHTIYKKKQLIECKLTSSNMTSTEVATLVAETISSKLDTYITKSEGANVSAYTKAGVDTTTGSEGTSGFTISKLITGKKSDQSISLTNNIRSRDIIKPVGYADTFYTEVLDVYDSSFRLRSPATWDTGFYKIQVKNVQYVDNDSHIYINCAGKVDSDSNLITNASYVVKDLLIEAGLDSRLNDDSFDRSAVNIPYEMSFKIPNYITDTPPLLKDVIDSINKTVIGSLVITDDLQLAFNCLDSERISDALPTITDSDRISWKLKSSGQSYKYIVAQYKFTDIEELPSTEYLYTSDFTNKYTQSELTMNEDFMLYHKDEAEEAAQRRLYYNTLSRSDIDINGSLNLAKFNMGDKLIINFSDLYMRLGNNSSNKIMGVVSAINKSGESVSLTVTTLGGAIYNRNGIISADDANDFDDASEDEKLYCSYIVGNDGTINNSSDLTGCNSIA